MNKTAKNIALSTITLIVSGTGTVYSIEEAPEWQELIESRVAITFEKNHTHHSQLDIRAPIEHLENIRAILNPPVATLANLFGVSRQAIYKWLAEDSSPDLNNLARILELSKIADTFKKAGVNRGGALLNMKLFEGQSLLDLLKTNKPHEQQVRELIAEAQIIEAAYQKSGLAESNAKPTDDWLSSVSIPFHHEET